MVKTAYVPDLGDVIYLDFYLSRSGTGKAPARSCSDHPQIQ